MHDHPLRMKGRGAQVNPPNRFDAQRLEDDGDHLDELSRELLAERRRRSVPLTVVPDQARTILNRVDSPDLPFRWTLNPYRGCEHGCVYCYARPDHERLGYSSGTDFETRILVKHDAAKLLRRELARPGWAAETIMLAGDTDAYQPLEAEHRLTRQCLEVMADCRQPVAITTKRRLVTRDLDLLTELRDHRAIHVGVSLTTLNAELASKLEPRASSPMERLRTIRELADAGIPVIAMVAPIIPGLTDRETPTLLQAASDAGARAAAGILLRLPHQVKDLFDDWLRLHRPDRREKVLSLIRDTRDGALYQAAWCERHRGRGPVAEQIHQVFDVFRRRCGLADRLAPLSGDAFRPPAEADGRQMRLFG